MAKRRTSRLFWRERGGARRAYGDFRDYADVGGGREALIVPGEKVATADPDAAERVAGARLKELEAKRRIRSLQGEDEQYAPATLASVAREHLIKKKQTGKFSDRYLGNVEHQLERARDYLGADRDLATVRVRDVTAWLAHLADTHHLAGGTLRHHLNALSNLYRRAQADGFVPPGFNPAAALMEKPSASRQEAKWLESPDAALLLEAARTYRVKRQDIAAPFMHELLATFLLTGGRRAEVLGLEVSDVSFDRKTVTFRPNTWRGLKTATSHRVVPLWPQLEEILRPYVFGGNAPLGHLLFPSYRVRGSGERGGEHLLEEPRKALDAIAERAGWKAGEIRTKMFRHSYCAARLQTLDKGAPVSPFTVSKEMGHGGTALVERIYGHLGAVRHRAKVVEFRVAQWKKQLGDRLAAMAGRGRQARKSRAKDR